MKTRLPSFLRHALLAVITVIPSYTLFISSFSHAELDEVKDRLWPVYTIGWEPHPNDGYWGEIHDKLFSDFIIATDTSFTNYGSLRSFGGAAINLNIAITPKYGVVSYYFDNIRNSRFEGNQYFAKGSRTSIVSGGAVSIADCVVGQYYGADTEVQGIFRNTFTKNLLQAYVNLDSSEKAMQAYGGALSLMSNNPYSTSTTASHGHDLEAFVDIIYGNDFDGNVVQGTGLVGGGALAIFDIFYHEGNIPTVNKGIVGNSFVSNHAINQDEEKNASSHDAFALGGAIFINIADTPIIQGEFNSNEATSYSSNSYSGGGAIALLNNATHIENVGVYWETNADVTTRYESLFKSNTAIAFLSTALGGAILDQGINSEGSHLGGAFLTNIASGKLQASGGAIHLDSAQYASISGYFIKNESISANIASGGAISLYSASNENFEKIMGNIVGIFQENRVSNKSLNFNDYSYEDSLDYAYGGAIAFRQYVKASNLEIHMIGNSLTAEQAYGGAIYMNSSEAGHVFQYESLDNPADSHVSPYDAAGSKLFENNKAYGTLGAYGGAVMLIDSTILSTSGDITGNEAQSESGSALGGAFHLTAESTMGNHTGSFTQNTVISTSGAAEGGALYLSGKSSMGDILGDISNNKSEGHSAAAGAAISLTGASSITSITGDISYNTVIAHSTEGSANSSNAKGGALSLENGSSIGSLIGSTIEGNSVKGYDARGGAIYLSGGSRIDSISHSIINNEVIVSSDILTADRGGAVYNENSHIEFSTYRADITIKDNVIKYGNSVTKQFLYNTATDSNSYAVAVFDTAIKAPEGQPSDEFDNDALRFDINVYDSISGSAEFVDNQFIYINPNDNGYGVGKFNLYSSIRNQTVVINYGTISTPTYEAGKREEHFYNSHVIVDGFSAELNLYEKLLDSDSSLTNKEGWVYMHGSTIDIKKIINDSNILQQGDFVLNTFTSSTAQNVEDAGLWRIGPKFHYPEEALGNQGYRLTIGENALISRSDSNNTVYGYQQFYMAHNYEGSLHDLSQLTFENLETLEELLLNDAISFNLQVRALDGSQEPGPDSSDPKENVKWTFASWEGGGRLSDAALAKLKNLLTIGAPTGSYLDSQQTYLYLTENGITLLNTPNPLPVIDAKYTLSTTNPSPYPRKADLSIHHYDSGTTTLTAEDNFVIIEDTLGDDLNLTGPDAKFAHYVWQQDTESGSLYLQYTDPDAPFQLIADVKAFGLGTQEDANSDIYIQSYVDLKGYSFKNENNHVIKMDSDFVGNASANGALINRDAQIDLLEGDFVANYFSRSESTDITQIVGAINNMSQMGSIEGDFIANRISIGAADITDPNAAYGAAVHNSGSIKSIEGDFLLNHIYNFYSNSFGGAISNTGDANTSIEKVNGQFFKNHTIGETALGGAIFDDGGKGISIINGRFDGNYTRGYSVTNIQSRGGAIYRNNVSGTSEYTADFISNYAEAGIHEMQHTTQHAAGGAIYHANSSGAIKSITGDFTGNYALAHSERMIWVSDESQRYLITAKGGAIANVASNINNISGDFFANYTKAVHDQTLYNQGADTSIEPTLSVGGAIYNQNGNIGLLAFNRSITFEGNRAIRIELRPLSTPEIITEFNAIYNEYHSTIHLNAYGSNTITFNDNISGNSASRDMQLLKINSGLDGSNNDIAASNTLFSVVEFNNKVSHQTISVHGGTLRFGEYEGKTFTMPNESFDTEDSIGLLVNSKLTINSGARVEAAGENLGSDNTILVNRGTLALSEGELRNDISLNTGRMEISGKVSLQQKEGGGKTMILLEGGSGSSFITGLHLHPDMTTSTLTGGSIVAETDSSLTLSHLQVENISIDAKLAKALTMDSIVFNKSNVSLDLDSKIATLKNSTLTGLTHSDKIGVDNPTGGYFSEAMAVYNLTELSVFSSLDIEGTLTLDLGNLHEFNKEEFTAFRLTDVSDIGMWHGNVFVLINGERYQILGATNNGFGDSNDLYLYIPEPSTATLSLLALASLLMRRRRKL